MIHKKLMELKFEKMGVDIWENNIKKKNMGQEFIFGLINQCMIESEIIMLWKGTEFII